jgi:hypothetical protein
MLFAVRRLAGRTARLARIVIFAAAIGVAAATTLSSWSSSSAAASRSSFSRSATGMR